ncbi:hypothetical protein HZC53_04700 [Candidatus Uhrbacteria bacterium]|nr:hypothetical protein [Candidatus Uhrbacteria bacterium]
MSLADEWNRRLGRHITATRAKTAKRLETEGRAWAEEIIAKVPAAMETAASQGKMQIEVGEFRGDDIPPHKGEYFPERDELQHGALFLFDYCQREGLRLFVGGDFKMSGSYRPPFEVIIRLKR